MDGRVPTGAGAAAPYAVAAPFRVAPDLLRLDARHPDDPHPGVLVVDDLRPAFLERKRRHLHDPHRPLVRLAPGVDDLRLRRGLADALTALAAAHPDIIEHDDAAGVFRLRPAALAVDPGRATVSPLSPEAGLLAQRLAAEPPAARVLAAVSLALQEDLVLMGWPGEGPIGSRDDPAAAGGLVALAGSVVSPSGWDPAQRIGQPLADLHAPVADGERLRQASLALSRAMVEKGPYVRYVWTLAQHASPARWPGDPILRTEPRADLSDLWLRAERQVTLPLPRAGASLFLIRVLLEPLVQAAADVSRRDRLVASLRSMSEAVVAYKHIAEARERVLAAWG
jgi:hypothetical protein